MKWIPGDFHSSVISHPTTFYKLNQLVTSLCNTYGLKMNYYLALWDSLPSVCSPEGGAREPV